MRHITFVHTCVDTDEPTHTARMQARLDAPELGRRFATVQTVFGNLRATTRLDRFTLRDRAKVNGRWTLHLLARNIEKPAHAEPAIYAHIRLLRRVDASTRTVPDTLSQ